MVQREERVRIHQQVSNDLPSFFCSFFPPFSFLSSIVLNQERLKFRISEKLGANETFPALIHSRLRLVSSTWFDQLHSFIRGSLSFAISSILLFTSPPRAIVLQLTPPHPTPPHSSPRHFFFPSSFSSSCFPSSSSYRCSVIYRDSHTHTYTHSYMHAYRYNGCAIRLDSSQSSISSVCFRTTLRIFITLLISSVT